MKRVGPVCEQETAEMRICGLRATLASVAAGVPRCDNHPYEPPPATCETCGEVATPGTAAAGAPRCSEHAAELFEEGRSGEIARLAAGASSMRQASLFGGDP